MTKPEVFYQPLTDLEMLGILQVILEAAWKDGKHFGISVACGVTGRVMHFPMEETMPVSCDRVEGRGIATKKAITLFLTQADTSKQIGEHWLTKPVDKDGTQPHRELAYLGDPANLTGYEGAHYRTFEREGWTTKPYWIKPTDAKVENEAPATFQKIVIIACSGYTGEVDALYAEMGFRGFFQVWDGGLDTIQFTRG